MKFTKLQAYAEGRTLKEAKGTEYADSAEFTSELMDLGGIILNAKRIMKSPRWLKWMHLTDDNFDTNTVKLNADAQFALNKLDEAFAALEKALYDAE